MLAGAVYSPPADNTPTAGFMLQVTAVLVVPDTAAVRLWLWELVSVAVAGLTATATGVTMLMTPSEVVTVPALPSPRASTGFMSWIARFPLAAGASVIATTATTPRPSGVVERPVSRHMVPEQDRVLPAAAAASPSDVVTEVVSVLGKFKFHWIP